MKKYFKTENEKKAGRWSDGFSNTKNGKPDKNNKPGKNDDCEFDDGTVLLIDTAAKCRSITGKVSIYATPGATLDVNGKKII